MIVIVCICNMLVFLMLCTSIYGYMGDFLHFNYFMWWILGTNFTQYKIYVKTALKEVVSVTITILMLILGCVCAFTHLKMICWWQIYFHFKWLK